MAEEKSLTRGKNLFPRANHKHENYPWLVLANIMLGTFMAVLDSTIVNVGLSSIMNAFGTTMDTIEWVLTAYMLIMAVMLPASGWIADHFGYKRTYFLALFLFTLGSLLCGLAWDEMILIVFRVIQGCGAGLLMPTGMAITTRTFPPHKRGIALGFWGIAAAASISLGPAIGGYLIDHFSWHAIFLVNVPFGIIGLMATIIIQREYRTEHIRTFDFVGALTMTIFLTSLLLALSCGNSSWNTGGWTSPFIMTCFALAFIGFVIFLYVELAITHPLIDLRLLTELNFAITNLVLFIFGFGLFGSTFLLPYYLENSLGYTALQAGMVFLPVGILQAVMSPISGILSDKGNPKIPAFLGIVLLGWGLYANSFLSLYSETAQITYPLIIRGLAMGLIFTPLSTLALARIPREKMAQASGLLNVIRQIGGSFGVAVFGTLLTRQTLLHTAIYGQSTNLYSPVFQETLRKLILAIQHSTGKITGNFWTTGHDAITLAEVTIAQHIAKQAFVQAICDDFLIAALATIVCIFPLIFVQVPKMAKKGPGPSLE